MKNPADVMKDILAICPSFKEAWDDESSIWSEDDGTYTYHGLYAVLSHHVAKLLETQDTGRLGALFALVEETLTGSNDQLSNATATCFLENLMNRVPLHFAFETFEPMLGPASKEFCKAYGNG
jgi:hypothetical protein